MDTLKAIIQPVPEFNDDSFITRGEDRTLSIQLQQNGSAKQIDAYSSFRIFLRKNNGGTLIIATSDITKVDDGTVDKRGLISVVLTASITKELLIGKKIEFMVEAVNGTAKEFYMGEIHEIRESIY